MAEETKLPEDENTAKTTKIPLAEYQQQRLKRNDKKDKMLNAWPIQIALILPTLFFIFLICFYIFYAKNQPIN